jgi:hypothetical protein
LVRATVLRKIALLLLTSNYVVCHDVRLAHNIELEKQQQDEQERQRQEKQQHDEQQQQQKQQPGKTEQQHEEEEASSNYFEELAKEILGQIKSDFNTVLNVLPQTVQGPIRSAGSLVGRTVSSVGKPAFQQLTKQGAAAFKVGVKAGKKTAKFTQQQLVPKAKQLVEKAKLKVQEMQAKKAAEKAAAAAAAKQDNADDYYDQIEVDGPEAFGFGSDTDYDDKPIVD